MAIIKRGTTPTLEVHIDGITLDGAGCAGHHRSFIVFMQLFEFWRLG